MVFLILAAQYEQWSLPFAVITAVPYAICGAIVFVWLRGLENNIYFQISLLVLTGLAAKNAILIIEFAVMRRKAGLSRRDAALEAAKLRFRPIIMTSLAFILGVLPLCHQHGCRGGQSPFHRNRSHRRYAGGNLHRHFLCALVLPPHRSCYLPRKPDRKSSFMKTSPFYITGMGVAALLLGGCTLTPDYQAPKLDLPDQPLGQRSQEAPQAAEHLQQWWTRFDSPTLNQWVDEVLAANRDLQKAAARIEQSRATLGLQSSGLLPTLSAQGAATRQQYALSQVSSENLRIQNRFNLSGMLSYEVDLFGKLRSARSAAKEGLIASEYGYQSLQNALIAETITTWLNLAAANEQLTLAEETVRTRQESLEVQTTRYKAGFITELEAQQAAAELADAEIQLPALRQAIQQLHTSLLVLAGREPSEILGGSSNSMGGS